VTFYVSAVWGQTDAIFSMLLLACLILCTERQWFFAGAYAAIAVTTKFQAIIIFPLLPFLLPLDRKAWMQSAGGFFLMLLVVLLPFAVTPHGLEHVFAMYSSSIGRYAVVSANGYNFWWALLGGEAAGRSSMDPLLGFITYRMAATFLVALSYIVIISLLFRVLHTHRSKRDRATAIFLAAGALALAFFLFNTEMHERYSFPFITLFFPVLFLRKGYRGLYIAASILIFFNILGVLPLSPVDKWLFSVFPNFRGMIAALLVCVFFLLLRRMKQDARVLNASLASPWNLRPLLAPKKKTKVQRTR
jgi:Gpi18-like mannosyltransferase